MEAARDMSDAVSSPPATDPSPVALSSPSDASSAAAAVGRVCPVGDGDVLLDRFMLMREVGRGGTSIVFRARDLLAVLSGNIGESDIAIKLANVSGSSNELLLREALSTRHLSHPNVLKVYDYHRDGNVVFVTMELVEGEPLSRFVSRYPGNKLRYPQMKQILQGAVAGIAAAHRYGIVHSDIKPSNILLSDTGQIKVIDFASSRRRQPALADADNAGPEYLGYTLAYASPRLLRDESPAIQDDIFSLACVIYELLSGRQARPDATTAPSPQTATEVGALPRPSALGWCQWWLLKAAMSERGCSRYRSVGQFWWCFRQARYTVWYLLALLLCVSALMITTPAASHFLQGWTANVLSQSPAVDATEDLLHQYRNADLESRLAALAAAGRSAEDTGVTGIGVTARSANRGSTEPADPVAIKAHLQEDTIAQVEEKVSAWLRYDSASYAVPPFEQASDLLNDALLVYPDSLRLHRASSQLELEKQQYITFLLQEYLRHWDATADSAAYSTDRAVEINNILSALQTLAVDGRQKSEIDAIDRLMQVLLKAEEEGDFRSWHQAYDFARAIDRHDVITTIVQGLNSDLFEYAGKLLSYDEAAPASYPQQAALIWSEPRVLTLGESLEKAWTDQELLAVFEQLKTLMTDFRAPPQAEFLQPLLQKMNDKFVAKLQFHDSRKHYNSHQSLQQVYRQFLAATGLE